MRDGLLNGAIAEELRLGPSTYPSHGKARTPEHELSPIYKQVPERFMQRGEGRNEALQLTVCALAEQRRDFRLLRRFLVSEDLMPHVAVAGLVSSPPLRHALFYPAEIVRARFVSAAEEIRQPSKCSSSVGIGSYS